MARVIRVAAVDEALVVRLFGGFAHLIQAFTDSDLFWPSVEELAGYDVSGLRERTHGEQLSAFFTNYLAAIRKRPWTLEVMASEVRGENALTRALVYIRERTALEFFEAVMSEDPPDDIDLSAVILLMALAVGYLGIRSRVDNSLGGIDLDSDAGWNRVEETIQLMLERSFNQNETESSHEE